MDGEDLIEKFGAAGLIEKICNDNWDGIHVCDYIPAKLSGTYYDFGQGRIPAGRSYYSDAAMTQIAGQTDKEYDMTFLFASIAQITVNGTAYYVHPWDCTAPVPTKGATYYSDTALTTSAGVTTRRYLCSAISEAYATVEIGGATYYARAADCVNSRPITVNNAQMYFEVGGINPYWRYGDSGGLTGNNPHMIMIPRDCLPNTMKMRRFDKIWSWDAGEEVPLTSSTAANGSQKNFVFTKDASITTGAIVQVFVDGVEVEATNTTLSGNNFTVTLSAAPASGATVTATMITDNDIWRHTACFMTLNDPDLGVQPLYRAALGADLAAHMYEGANGAGMRYPGEWRPGCASGSSSLRWSARGVLMLYAESEVWGSAVYGLKDQWNFLPQLPIFAGSHRRRTKGVGNGGFRTGVWAGSPYPSATHWCNVSNIGYANINIARNAYGGSPGFLLAKNPS